MNKNTIWAASLSFIILFGWFYFFGNKQQKQVQQIQQTSTTQKTETKISTDSNSTGLESKLESDNQIMPEENYDFILENDKQKIVFNKNGGIKECFLKDKSGELVNLVYNEKNKLLGTNQSIVYDKNFEKEKGLNNQDKKLVLFGKFLDSEDLIVKTTYEFKDEKYLVNVKMEIENRSLENSKTISNFQIFLGEGIATDEKLPIKQELKNMKFVYCSDGKIFNKKKKMNIGINSVNNSWIAISNNYFITAFIDKNNFFKSIEVFGNDLPLASYVTDLTIKPNEKTVIELDTIFSDKDYRYLKSFDKKLEKNVSLGFFGGIGKIVLFLLFLFESITGNYGWSIIILTLLLQLCLTPLNIKSYVSMHALRKIQPKLNALKTKYKDDAQKMNMEMMMLYKKEGVNPFGGCLPMLLQIPVFFALFTALRNAAELRHSPFIFWIKDLSRPDTVAHIAGISLNILPVFMCVSMFFSQKLNMGTNDNATPEENSMSKAMLFMPVMFLFMFWNFPSGLVLYWLVSNIFTVALNSYLKIRLNK
jgi:YidC/Oxa1 family membrane protein insertase